MVDTIRSLAPQEGQDAIEVFDNLMRGLEDQLGGMGTAFASSLLGLAGSLVVGLLELFASHAQNRFYRELEDWLSSITRIGIPGVEGEEALTAGNVLMVIGQTAEQIDSLREVVEQNMARTTATDDRITELTRVTETQLAELGRMMDARFSELIRLQAEAPPPALDPAILERIAAAQERTASILEARDEDAGQMDAETRARLRSIDTQVVRILEELAAGRQDMVTEIRQDLSTLAEALRAIVVQRRS